MVIFIKCRKTQGFIKYFDKLAPPISRHVPSICTRRVVKTSIKAVFYKVVSLVGCVAFVKFLCAHVHKMRKNTMFDDGMLTSMAPPIARHVPINLRPPRSRNINKSCCLIMCFASLDVLWL